MFINDKFHDECGVVAIFAHPEAEKLAYLGLHALQHRGQESAGIVTSDGLTSRAHKSMGRSPRSSPKKCWRRSVARSRSDTRVTPPPAILRCSTRSRSSSSRTRASIAVAHNGNLVNATQIRAPPREPGIDFPDQQRHRSDRPPDRASRKNRRCPRPWPTRCAAWTARFRWS